MESKRTKVFVGLPSIGTVIDSQAYILRDIAELYKDHIELVYSPVCVRRVFHDFSRNKIVEEFLATDCDILWFLDSDITPSVHVMDLVALHKDKWQVAGTVYPVFMSPIAGKGPEVVLTCYRKNSNGNMSLCTVPKDGQEFVDGLATGCLFIKREVFAKLEKPYFEFKFNGTDREMTEGEDLGFCRKLSALGIQFFTDFELVSKHQKSVDLLEVNNYAITYSNRAVMEFDSKIRSQIEGAIKSSFQRGFEAGMHADGKTPPKSKVLWTP